MSLKYKLDALGWYNFENLAQTLLKRIVGPGVTSFGGSKDGGRDAAYSGAAPFPSATDSWKGEWVFQVKYADLEGTGWRGARNQVKQAIGAEFRAILERGRRMPDNYVVITNVPLTNSSRTAIEAAVREEGYSGNFHSVDGVEVCQFLDLYPLVRRAYPQLIGLADLDAIINKELYTRSAAFVRDWQRRLATFVGTGAYHRAFMVLRTQRFVVLDGPPEAGKTTIAAALCLQLAAEGFEVIDVRGTPDFYGAFDGKRKQIFVADDAVGTITLDPSLSNSWSRDLPGIVRSLDPNHYLVWTTRTYILEEALAVSKLGDDVGKFPGPSEVLVQVGDLTLMEKAEILYNHAKQAGLTEGEKELVRTHAVEIVTHPNFTPEKVRQLFEIALAEWREG